MTQDEYMKRLDVIKVKLKHRPAETFVAQLMLSVIMHLETRKERLNRRTLDRYIKESASKPDADQ